MIRPQATEPSERYQVLNLLKAANDFEPTSVNYFCQTILSTWTAFHSQCRQVHAVKFSHSYGNNLGTIRMIQQRVTFVQNVTIILSNKRQKLYHSASYYLTPAPVTKFLWPLQYSHYLDCLCLRSISKVVHFSNRHPQTLKLKIYNPSI